MEREDVPHDGNNQQSFTVLPLKPNGQIMVHDLSNVLVEYGRHPAKPSNA
jgi:hypothetical protein